MNNFVKKIVNKLLKKLMVSHIRTNEPVIYLTFDDGPEVGITEFILDELKKYNFKGTFFCRGDNAMNNETLMRRIVAEGHDLANHTFSHFHSYKTNSKTYVADVNKVDSIINTNLFRPPYGSITLLQYLKLRKRYKFIIWDLDSGDSKLEGFSLNNEFSNLKNKTSPGNIVLFHFCKRHEKETRQILPLYLEFLKQENYATSTISVK